MSLSGKKQQEGGVWRYVPYVYTLDTQDGVGRREEDKELSNWLR